MQEIALQSFHKCNMVDFVPMYVACLKKDTTHIMIPALTSLNIIHNA